MKRIELEPGTNLPFIPPGLADELRPFDRFVFEVTKANCCRMCRAHMAGLGAINKQIAARFLIGTWERVRREVLDGAIMRILISVKAEAT